MHDIEADTKAIIAALVPKWRTFCEKVPFRVDDPLAYQIELFATPAIPAILQIFPSTKTAPPRLLWMMIFTAVLESNSRGERSNCRT